MAKKALIIKANAKPKFAVRAYTRCQRCGRPKAVYRKFGLCRICIRHHGSPRRASGRFEGFLVIHLHRRPQAGNRGGKG